MVNSWVYHTTANQDSILDKLSTCWLTVVKRSSQVCKLALVGTSTGQVGMRWYAHCLYSQGFIGHFLPMGCPKNMFFSFLIGLYSFKTTKSGWFGDLRILHFGEHLHQFQTILGSSIRNLPLDFSWNTWSACNWLDHFSSMRLHCPVWKRSASFTPPSETRTTRTTRDHKGPWLGNPRTKWRCLWSKIIEITRG